MGNCTSVKKPETSTERHKKPFQDPPKSLTYTQLNSNKTVTVSLKANVKSKTEEMSKVNQDKIGIVNTFNRKAFKNNISLNKVNSIYEVQANITDEVEEVNLVFFISSKIKRKYKENIKIVGESLLTDFEKYFLLNGKTEKSIDQMINIGYLEYDDNILSDYMTMSFREKEKFLKLIENPNSFDSLQVEVGEVNALNKLVSQLKTIRNKEKVGFYLFHFCDESSNNDGIYQVEIDTSIRELVNLKYEIIYFEEKNERYELILGECINYDIIQVENR